MPCGLGSCSLSALGSCALSALDSCARSALDRPLRYVPSKANIADLPSRGDTRLAARLLRDRFGVAVETRAMRLPPLRAIDGAYPSRSASRIRFE